jgi:hypothetical protein
LFLSRQVGDFRLACTTCADGRHRNYFLSGANEVTMHHKVNISGYQRAKVFAIVVACSAIIMAIYELFESIAA